MGMGHPTDIGAAANAGTVVINQCRIFENAGYGIRVTACIGIVRDSAVWFNLSGGLGLPECSTVTLENADIHHNDISSLPANFAVKTKLIKGSSTNAGTGLDLENFNIVKAYNTRVQHHPSNVEMSINQVGQNTNRFYADSDCCVGEN